MESRVVRESEDKSFVASPVAANPNTAATKSNGGNNLRGAKEGGTSRTSNFHLGFHLSGSSYHSVDMHKVQCLRRAGAFKRGKENNTAPHRKHSVRLRRCMLCVNNHARVDRS